MEVTTTGQWPAVEVMTTGQWPVVEVETVKKKNRCVVLNCAPAARDGDGEAPVSARSKCPAKRVLALSAERLRGVRNHHVFCQLLGVSVLASLTGSARAQRDIAGARRIMELMENLRPNAVCATCSS